MFDEKKLTVAWGWLWLVVSVILTISFVTGQTWYFEAVNLEDPSTSEIIAGRVIGGVISFVLAVALYWGINLYRKNVTEQEKALDDVHEEWQAHNTNLIDDMETPEECLNALKSVCPKDTRIYAVLDSWQDASPDSDAEYVIEGKAAKCRQQLGVLQTIASILVLIGLAGNFFGLADAVKKLPQLTQAAAKQAGTQSAPIEARTDLSVKEQDGKEGSRVAKNSAAPAPAQTDDSGEVVDPLEKPISGISDALSVVVVSSILGIGGMAVLLLFVASFKSIFNSMVTEEIVLMAAEIGSLLRPRGGQGGGLDEETQTAMMELASQVEKFSKAGQKVTNEIGESKSDLKVLAESLNHLLRHEMVEAKGAYETYQQSLDKFTGLLVDERKTLETLVKRTNSLCDGMENLATSVNGMAESTTESANRYQETQAKYENYLRLVTEQMEQRYADYERRLAKDEDALRDALQTVTDNQSVFSEDLLKNSESTWESLSRSLVDATKRSFEELRGHLSERLAEQHSAEMERLQELLDSHRENLNSVREDWTEATGSQRTLNEETLRIAHERLDETSEKLLQACDRFFQTQDTVLKAVVEHWKGEISGLSQESASKFDERFERLLEKLETHPAANESNDELVAALREMKESASRVELSTSSLEELRRMLEPRTNGRPEREVDAENSEESTRRLTESLTKALERQLSPLVSSLESRSDVAVNIDSDKVGEAISGTLREELKNMVSEVRKVDQQGGIHPVELRRSLQDLTTAVEKSSETTRGALLQSINKTNETLSRMERSQTERDQKLTSTLESINELLLKAQEKAGQQDDRGFLGGLFGRR